MSGMECIGAILGIAGVGIQVAATLYDYASTTSSAKDDMNMIAESIDTYSSVLETLGRQLEASEAVCSVEGVRLAQDLQRQSEVLFKKIAENIPSSKTETVSMRQKMSWFFQKDRVTYLLGQVEQLKATVSLLLQILILAQTTKPATRTETNHNTTHNVTNNVHVNVNVLNAEMNSQFRRAENRVMQYHNASVKLAKLQIEDEEPVIRNALPWQEEFEELPVVRQTENDNDDIAASFGQLALRQPRMTSADTNSNSAQLVNILLEHWTTVESYESTTTVVTEESPSPQSNLFASGNPSTNQNSKTPGDHLTRADTVPDTYEPTSEVTSAVRISSTATSTSTSNPVKGWWQKYRQSAKSKSEEEERQRQLSKQEAELKRRETQLQREQTLLERELKLQEAEKQKEEAKAKALAERERRAAESQKLQEATHKQALAERELRAQTEQRQKEARKEHLARLKDIRTQSRALPRKGSYASNNSDNKSTTDYTVTNDITEKHDSNDGSSNEKLNPPTRVSTTSSLSSPPSDQTKQRSSIPSPPLSQISDLLNRSPASSPLSLLNGPHQSHSHSHSNLHSHLNSYLTRPSNTSTGSTDSASPPPYTSDNNTTSDGSLPQVQSQPQSQPLEQVYNSLQDARALRKQKREEWKQARRARK